jgi:hypothetical protein
VNLLGGDIYIINKNAETLVYASKDRGLEINTVETEYILLYCQQNIGQYYDIKTAKRSFINVGQIKYLGTTVTNQYMIRRKLRGD